LLSGTAVVLSVKRWDYYYALNFRRLIIEDLLDMQFEVQMWSSPVSCCSRIWPFFRTGFTV